MSGTNVLCLLKDLDIFDGIEITSSQVFHFSQFSSIILKCLPWSVMYGIDLITFSVFVYYNVEIAISW